jgi:hypothetical protein
MLPVNRLRPGTTPHRKLATGSGAVLIALLFSGACSQPATEEPGSSGGSSGGSNTGGKSSSSNTGGSSSSSTGGSSGSTSTGGSGSSAAGSGGSAPTAGSGGSGDGTGGTSGGTGGGTGGAADDAGSPAGTGGTPGGPLSSEMPVCKDEPAATVPALKRTDFAKIPAGDEAGQIVGVPGEPGVYILGHTSGKVYYAGPDGMVDPTPMATVPSKSNPPQSEQGLLGMALHPKFAENHLFYLFYSAPNMRIDELERTGKTSSKMVRTIWDKARAAGGAFHNGGQILFNPMDKGKPILYHAVGNNANDGESGKPDGVAGRVLAHDLSGAMVVSKTISFGLRNPYRFTVDRLTGDTYIGETNGPPGGAIYGTTFASPTPDYGFRGGSVKAGITGGIEGTTGGDAAVIGGVVYRGTKIKGACGRYFFSGWKSGVIKSIVVKDGKMVGAATTHAGLGVGRISSFGEDGEGEMYIATQNSTVYKIEAM